ncbi:alpha/beta fold hydrolase [Citricoccus sp. SGAir0253]|uniref:alpha/beta fold hydrolase n=1 Tax=Citricoccus sp. SGAir0253 TaxID=2567881 RepID=UPI0010CCB919|nr:alpha/beta fold hydrolase [Citricoccus sp. SGAir0253]QCU77868.1 alpha/beta fold hydrolase [Citricoccus sp. SGAir0253]
MRIPASPAVLPVNPHGAPAAGTAPALPGWDPAWSRIVTVPAPDGDRSLHVLDTGPVLAAAGREPEGTILAVHGNPTWSYLWRSLAAATVEAARRGEGPAWRVVAPDQLDMGYSERLAHPALPRPAAAGPGGGPSPASDGAGYRTLAGRIADLDALVRTLGLDTAAREGHPLLTLGHDWGGVVSLGWAGRNQDLVTGAMTLNTAVHQDADEPLPAPLRAALAGPLLPGSTVLTDAFLRVTTSLARPSLDPAVRAAYHGPYRRAERRGGIGGFVADIPVGPGHASHAELRRVAADVAAFRKPVLLLWGPRDPVFLDRHLADLLERLPHADLHRAETAGHLLAEEIDLAAPVLRWAGRLLARVPAGAPAAPDRPGSLPAPDAVAPGNPGATGDTGTAPGDHRPLWAFLDEWRDRPDTALVDLAGADRPPVGWDRLAGVVDAVAVGLLRHGVRPGDRISLLVTPGLDLTAALYASLRIGAVVVVADAGLGVAGMTRAVRAARPDWIIGRPAGLAVARTQRWPGRRLSVETLPRPLAAALGVEDGLHAMAARHAGERCPEPGPGPGDPAAILYTSGSTGPAKGVLYTHGRLAALAGLLRDVFDVRPGSSLLAGFAPFALLGPAIGATSITPDMSVTRPATLTATAVAEAAAAGHATMLFASPAALRNVVATADALTHAQRAALGRITLVLSAGAPVHPRLVEQVGRVFPAADLHSPYGMTEALLLADIDREGLTRAATAGSAEDGVCVGRPVGPVRIAIAPLGADGTAAEALLEGPEAAGVLGEVVVSAPHQKAAYDRLWLTDATSRRDHLDGLQWHRTQDVGHLDDAGRLWIEGRLQHVVVTDRGPVAPGGPEARIDALGQVSRSAVVGVGPRGTQAVVAVVETAPGVRARPGLAPTALAAAVRSAAAPVPVAAVLVTDRVPVDIRHNSKIDRSRLARWAAGVLAGGRVGRP